MFRRLISEHSPRLLAMARSFALDTDDAHDLVQETWIRVYRKRRRFEGHGTFVGWLISVCRNVCLDAIAKRASRARSLGAAMIDQPTECNPTVHHEMDRQELRRSIHQALMELPPRERDVVIMRMIEGNSVRETAERMGCAEGTVKATLHHAVAKLKNAMEVWAND